MMAVVGTIAVIFEVVYTTGSAWVLYMFHREWQSLKRGIVAGQLTDRNMRFMDVLTGDDNPVKTGFVTAILWPKIAWDIMRERRKDRA